MLDNYCLLKCSDFTSKQVNGIPDEKLLIKFGIPQLAGWPYDKGHILDSLLYF